jgi:hypothetical protein
MAHVPIFRGEALMLNSQPLAMMRSSGTGELGVLEGAELPLAGDKIAAVGNHCGKVVTRSSKRPERWSCQGSWICRITSGSYSFAAGKAIRTEQLAGDLRFPVGESRHYPVGNGNLFGPSPQHVRSGHDGSDRSRRLVS